MKKPEQQLKEMQTSVHMSADERQGMHERLHEYMKMNPLPVKQSPALSLSKSRFSFVSLLQKKLLPAFLVLLLVSTTGVGITYASEQALPGEALYTVKEIIENMHESILISDIAKAELSERLMHRRADEAHQLKKLGMLDEARQAIIGRRIARHTARAERVLSRVSLESPQKAVRIRAALQDSEAQLLRIAPVYHAQKCKELMRMIDTAYAESENALKEIEKDIEEIETLIHS